LGGGCLRLLRCRLSNPNDSAAAYGPGAAYFPRPLHPDPNG
jgi:MerR family redox-sensitive transcriptional activator SoxR